MALQDITGSLLAVLYPGFSCSLDISNLGYLYIKPVSIKDCSFMCIVLYFLLMFQLILICFLNICDIIVIISGFLTQDGFI
jgi:hypothetical protein